MTDSFIPAGTTGKKLQTYENTVGSNVVHSEAVTLTNSSGEEVGVVARPIRTDPTGTTTQPVNVASALPSGTNNIGDVDVLTLPALVAGTALVGAATPGASASVGTATTAFRDPAVTNTAVAIKASAGKLHGYNLYNPNSSLAYVHFYNVAAASVTVGTTTPIRSVALPSTANGTVAVDREFTLGIAFGTAMSVAASTTATGGGAPSTALVVNAEYI